MHPFAAAIFVNAFLLFLLMVATTSGLLWFARRKGVE